VPASPCFSETRLARFAKLAALVCALSIAGACATVRPEDKEYLAEPSMTWANSSFAARHESHIVENREGSNGGSQTKGGGCGCN
jgi:Domain of unknown function (DUF4266)